MANRPHLNAMDRMIAPNKEVYNASTSPQTGLRLYGFIVAVEGTTFTALEINGRNVLASRGLSGVSLSKDYQFFTSIGDVITSYTISGGAIKELHDL